MTTDDLPLQDAVASLRAELAAIAAQAPGDADFTFGLGPIELTLQTAVTRSADGKIGWSVIGIGGSRGASSEQTLKLVLLPNRRQVDGTYSTDFKISGVMTEDPFGTASDGS